MINTGTRIETTMIKKMDVMAKIGTRAFPADWIIHRKTGRIAAISKADKRNVLI